MFSSEINILLFKYILSPASLFLHLGRLWKASGRFCIMRQTTRRNLPGSLSHDAKSSGAFSFLQ
jgi:hypothetical protein